ncbi:MAG: prohibitin family protein [Patescibacteria group bacterium]
MNFFDDSPEEQPVKRGLTRSLWFPWSVAAVILVTLAIIFSPVVFIPVGHQGVATFMGDLQSEEFKPGFQFKYPLLRVHQFDTRTQSHDVSVGVVTKDMQLVTVKLTLGYRLEADKLHELYASVGRQVEEVMLDPAVKEAVNIAAAQFIAEDLVTYRAAFSQAALDAINLQLTDSGVVIDEVAVIDVGFSAAFEDALVAQAMANKELELAKIKRQTAKVEAETQTTMTDAEIARIKLLGPILNGNEAYLQYEILKKWNGSTPLYISPVQFTPPAE